MEHDIRATTAAGRIVSTRPELAALLNSTTDLIAEIISAPPAFYTCFSIPKSNGELRVIRPPRPILRRLQRSLLNVFYHRVRFPSWVHGGVPRRSIVTHASTHVGRRLVMTADLRSFFPSTTPAHLGAVLGALGFAGDAAADLMELATLEGGLPQGAPTSSLLANLSFAAGDTRFIKLCRARKLAYSRYVDDIAVSGNEDFRQLYGSFSAIIQSAGYKIVDNKVKMMPAGARQVVTGLVVNEKLRPTREYLAQLKRVQLLILQAIYL